MFYKKCKYKYLFTFCIIIYYLYSNFFVEFLVLTFKSKPVIPTKLYFFTNKYLVVYEENYNCKT